MSRFFIILATSIALAGAGVPARAQVRMDNGNVIFGAAAMLVPPGPLLPHPGQDLGPHADRRDAHFFQ